MHEYAFVSCIAAHLEAGKLFTTHLGEVLTFSSVNKGTDLHAKPLFFRAPITILERFVTTFGA
jgi:hypothetical protein